MGKETQTAQNQTGQELALQWGRGRQGVEKMLTAMADELRTIAAPNVAGDFDVWKMRAFVEITTSDALKPIIAEPHGMLSIYQGLSKAAVMGLQIGGQFPHAYFVPKSGRAVMMPTKDGYLFTSTYGPGALLAKWPELQKVYDKDEFRLDDAARTYEHKYQPFADRGKLVGYFMVLEYKDGRKIVRHILQSKVKAIEGAYGLDSPAYKKSPDEMDEKTAIKWMLRDVVRESEGLAMLDSLDSDGAPDREPALPMRDVTERSVDRLARAAETVGPGTSPEPAAEPEQQPAAEAQPATAAPASGSGPKELF
ncbi:MAG TPA: recombinase RecT [Coriobacteriia bacterium]|nr:recombinase RecT [Coriobacteriia bacterium]